jgi:hypothetical protein
MSAMFNTKRLIAGRTEVEEIYEIADMLGVDVIKVNGEVSSKAVGSVNGFEIGRIGFNPHGGVSGAVKDVGYLYLYPDKYGTRWGFVLDTEYNRIALSSHIAAPILDIADAKVKAELIEYCDANGVNTVPEAAANPYIKKSIQEEKLEVKNNKLESSLRQMEAQLALLREEKDETERAMLRKEQYRDSNTDTTVTKIQVNPETGEGEKVEVEATTAALNKAPVRKKKESKADKPLAGKKIAK